MLKLESFGLPLGSALILMAILDTATKSELLAGLIFTKSADNEQRREEFVGTGTRTGSSQFVKLLVINLAVDALCLVCGVIIEGYAKPVRIWRGFKITCLVGLICILLFYSVLAPRQEGYHYHEEKSFVTLYFIDIYFMAYHAIWYTYEINFTSQCIPLLKPSSMSELELEVLEPIGKGVSFIVEYFKKNSASAACLALTTEMMFNVDDIVGRHVPQYGITRYLPFNDITLLTVENTFMRYVRFGIGLVGLLIVHNRGGRKLMLGWCFLYLVTLMNSLAIFGYTIVMWSSLPPMLMFSIAYLPMFAVGLIFRTGVLFVCLRYSPLFEEKLDAVEKLDAAVQV